MQVEFGLTMKNRSPTVCTVKILGIPLNPYFSLNLRHWTINVRLSRSKIEHMERKFRKQRNQDYNVVTLDKQDI